MTQFYVYLSCLCAHFAFFCSLATLALKAVLHDPTLYWKRRAWSKLHFSLQPFLSHKTITKHSVLSMIEKTSRTFVDSSTTYCSSVCRYPAARDCSALGWCPHSGIQFTLSLWIILFSPSTLGWDKRASVVTHRHWSAWRGHYTHYTHYKHYKQTRQPSTAEYSAG